MASKYGVYIEMGEYKVSKTLIYTDYLASCHCLLIYGLYEDVPFAFMNHNSFGVVADRTSNNLKLLLAELGKILEVLVLEKVRTCPALVVRLSCNKTQEDSSNGQ